MFATDSTVQKIMLGFDFDRLFEESTMYQINADESGINFTTLSGLIDVLFTNVVGGATFEDVTFDAKLSYGTALNKILYQGADNITDWTLTNVTTGLPITPLLGATEGPDGTYILTFAAQSTTDSIKVEVSRIGYDGEVTFVMP